MPEITLLKSDVRISPENIITKSNLLIDSNYRLSTLESKLIATLFSNVQPLDQQFNTYVFPIKEFTDFLELRGKSKYKDLRDITKSLMEKVFEIKIGDDIHQVSWLSYVRYNERKGSITLRFDTFWEPYILQLKKNFTSYRLGNITNLKSSYSIRLYELLKQRQGLKKRLFDLQELREKLGVEENMYPRYANFKQRVLLTAQRELREESDIYFDFAEIKSGRAVTKIEFIIHHNLITLPKEDVQIDNSKEKVDVILDLVRVGIAKKDAESLLNLFPQDRIADNITYTEERVRKGAVKQPGAYLKRAIEQDYASTKKTAIRREEKLPEWWNNTQKSDDIISPIEKEKSLLEKFTLMTELNKSEDSIYTDLAEMMRNYQQLYFNSHKRLIDSSEFSHPFIRKICEDIKL